METRFTDAQRQDPDIASSEQILRRCVHCGFCTATCPTFALLGDELDSPRGRIYLIKDMLENDRPASREVVTHLDRCLSCLSCMTTCPSGVHYQHLIDHARIHVEKTYRRPWFDRLLRAILARILPYPRRFALALRAARLGRPLKGLMRGRLKAMLSLAPSQPIAGEILSPQVFPAVGERKQRVALLAGCAQQVLAPQINRATIDILTRHGVEVVVAADVGCCGALVHHMGKDEQSHSQTIANVRGWLREIEGEGLDAILVNTSGCGTQVKDYGHMLRTDPTWAEPAARVAALAGDITEFLDRMGPLRPTRRAALNVTYHSACSMQHGQKITTQPTALLKKAGFRVKGVPEGHLCCGSAGVYNIMQPAIANQLRERKVANIAKTGPDVIAAGNIGCITQIQAGTDTPIVHTVELLNWMTGGRPPVGLPQDLIDRAEDLPQADARPALEAVSA